VKVRYLFFALTIFLSSFLLFQVQPIIGKYILPWFGGTSAVWTTAMLFFQTVLLLGYSYTLFISKLSIKKQIILHSLIVLAIGGLLGFLFTKWQVPILPDVSFKPDDSFSPILQVLFILSISVGLPYFLLSTTSILLQKWFSIIQSEKSPYPLYALSNTASLLALLTYPVVIEPFLPLQYQGIWWAAGFLCYAAVLLLCSLQTFFSQKHIVQKKAKTVTIPRKTIFIWLALSSISTLMLLSATAMLTQSIAPIPFLWVLPLSLYLLSFILCFSGSKWYKRNLYAYIFLVTAPFVVACTFSQVPSLVVGLILYSLMLFSCCMLCHGELYHLKPPAQRLDTFYVLIALGSVISGIFSGVIAPLLFRGFWEVYFAFYLGFFLAFILLVEYKNSMIYRRMHIYFSTKKELYWCIGIGFPLVMVAMGVALNSLSGYNAVTTWRNFYGVIAVKQKNHEEGPATLLFHGNVVHGTQYSSKSLRYGPTAYYGPESGISRVLKDMQKKQKQMTVGVVGLGVGTLAAFGRTGDTYVFYEINPQVVDVAYSHFTYLADTPAAKDVVLGDGRLSVEKDKRQFDVIVLDAFSDDAIPVHLLTREAFTSYLKKLNTNGVIIVNISNNFINLKPLLQQVAKHFDLKLAVVRSHAKGIYTEAEWAVLSKNKTVLPLAQNKEKTVRLWTDDYSNLFQILK
jgi:hypothetical protein